MSKNTNNIRSRCFNLVLYPHEDISHSTALEFITKHYSFAYIVHDMDTDENGEFKKIHCHVVIQFPNARSLKSVADELGIETNYLEKTSDLPSSLLYLIHFYDKDKYQYSLDSVVGPLSSKISRLIKRGTRDECDFYVELLNYISDSNRFISIMELSRYASENGFQDYFSRRSYHFTTLINEHNNYLSNRKESYKHD